MATRPRDETEVGPKRPTSEHRLAYKREWMNSWRAQLSPEARKAFNRKLYERVRSDPEQWARHLEHSRAKYERRAAKAGLPYRRGRRGRAPTVSAEQTAERKRAYLRARYHAGLIPPPTPEQRERKNERMRAYRERPEVQERERERHRRRKESGEYKLRYWVGPAAPPELVEIGRLLVEMRRLLERFQSIERTSKR